jgi:hypothetical protein
LNQFQSISDNSLKEKGNSLKGDRQLVFPGFL